MNETQVKEQRNHEDALEKKRDKAQIYQMEIGGKETENENMKNRLRDEKKEFEVEQKERLLRDIQVTQIEIEDKRKEVAIKEADLRKDYSMLEKKKTLLQSDREELQRKLGDLEEERSKFEEQHRKLKWTSEQLALERDEVSVDQAKYRTEKDMLAQLRKDLDYEKSINQSDRLRAEEIAHELKQRENMLNMF